MRTNLNADCFFREATVADTGLNSFREIDRLSCVALDVSFVKRTFVADCMTKKWGEDRDRWSVESHTLCNLFIAVKDWVHL